MKVVAKKPFEYRGKVFAVDDEVPDVPPALARAWQMMRRADIKAEDGAAEATDEGPQKRRYKRRDMRVEE